MVRVVALILTVLTGFSGLVYQVAWQKYLAVLLGSHAEATAAVLGIFLGGLSAGYALFGRISGRLIERAAARGDSPRLLSTYGFVEAGIGVYALVFPGLFVGIQRVSLLLPHASDGVSFALDVGLVALLIGPPTVLMGGTIPLLTQGLSKSLDDATRFHALVYSFNTVGAFGGALAAGFYLVPTLGLRGCVLAMGVVNLAAGAVFIAMGRSRASAFLEPEPVREDQALGPTLYLFGSVALLSGFAMMTFQTALNRLGALSLGASHFTFAMIVAVFVLSIALGSLAVSTLPRIRPSYLVLSQWALVALLIAGYPYIQDAPYWTHVLRVAHPVVGGDFLPFYSRIFGWGLLLLLVPIGLSGAMLPLVFHHLRHEVGDLGAIAGRLYAWNTVGSLLGALLGGYLLLFWLDLHQTYRVAVAALGVGASLITLSIWKRGLLWGVVGLVATLATLVAMPAWNPERFTLGLYRSQRGHVDLSLGAKGLSERLFADRKIVFYDDDPVSSVAVIATGEQAVAPISIVNNGKSDGEIPGDNTTTGMLGLIPAIFADEPKRAFIVGYGTGHTVGTLAALDSIEEVVVAEISSGVMDAAPYFAPYTNDVIHDPKTRAVRSDAYRALLRGEGKYDIISSEPTNPWVAGVEMLFSREFLRAARSRLTPQGVYAQWMHLYETDRATVALAFRTYLDVFDRVAVWSSRRHDVILLGFNEDDGKIDLHALKRRFESPDFVAEFRKLGVNDFAGFLAYEVVPEGVLNEAPLSDRVHTILNPILSDYAVRAFLKAKPAELPLTYNRSAAAVGMRNSLARRYLESLPPDRRSSTLRQMARAACATREDRCLTVVGAWNAESPASNSLQRFLEAQRRDPVLTESLSDQNVEYVSQLFSPEGVQDVAPTYETARKVDKLFEYFYYHALPFDGRSLEAAWKNCSADPRCLVELSRARGIGIPLDGAEAGARSSHRVSSASE